MRHKQTEGLNGGESPGQVPVDWRITANDPATRCIKAILVDDVACDNVTEIRHFADGMFAVGEFADLVGADGSLNLRMRLAKSVRVMWKHRAPCNWCRVWRRNVVLEFPRRPESH